jgi:hypothetical protein
MSMTDDWQSEILSLNFARLELLVPKRILGLTG